MPDGSEDLEVGAAMSDHTKRLVEALEPGEVPAATLTNDFLSDLTYRTVRNGNRSTRTTTRTYLRIPVVFTDRRVIQVGAALPKGTVRDYFSKAHPVFSLDAAVITSIRYERVERIRVISGKVVTRVVVRQYTGEELELKLVNKGGASDAVRAGVESVAEGLRTGACGGSAEDRARLAEAAGRIEANRGTRSKSIAVALGVSAVAAVFCAGAGLGGVSALAGLGFELERGMRNGIGHTIGEIVPGLCLALAMLVPALPLMALAMGRWRATGRVGAEAKSLRAELDALLDEVAGPGPSEG